MPRAASPVADDRRRARACAQISDAGALGAAVDGGDRGQSGGRRRLPRRQGAGHRLPHRPGHEGDPRPGERRRWSRRRSASGCDRAGRGLSVGAINLVLWGSAIVLIASAISRARGPSRATRRSRRQDANLARYDEWRGGVPRHVADGRVGGDADRCCARRGSAAAIAIVGHRAHGRGLRHPLRPGCSRAGRARRLAARCAAGGARSRCSGP